MVGGCLFVVGRLVGCFGSPIFVCCLDSIHPSIHSCCHPPTHLLVNRQALALHVPFHVLHEGRHLLVHQPQRGQVGLQQLVAPGEGGLRRGRQALGHAQRVGELGPDLWVCVCVCVCLGEEVGV